MLRPARGGLPLRCNRERSQSRCHRLPPKIHLEISRTASPRFRSCRSALATGATPLLRAERLARKLGLNNLYLKNDSVNAPTLSFKDRVTAVAINKALEFKLEAVGCASTGNLANSVAANAAAAGLPSFILIPRQSGTEQGRWRPRFMAPSHRGERKLRRRESSVQPDRRPVSVGIRQRQPAAVLCGRFQDFRPRDRRTTRLARSRRDRHPDGGRLSDQKNPQRPDGTAAHRAI